MPKHFAIVLFVRHSNLDPEDVSRELALRPLTSWKAGEPRVTPKGTQLQGVRRESSWSHVFAFQGDHSVSEGIETIVNELLIHRAFLSAVIAGGGTLVIYLQLPGDANQGASISPSTLKRMVDLGLGLDLEVFPHMRPYDPREKTIGVTLRRTGPAGRGRSRKRARRR